MIKTYVIPGDDFQVAGEASSNFKSVIHGGGGECEAEILKDSIRITFTDHGPGIPDIELAMQEGYSTASDRIREMGFGAGMGLPNMKKYADDMKILTGSEGTTLTLIINL